MGSFFVRSSFFVLRSFFLRPASFFCVLSYFLFPISIFQFSFPPSFLFFSFLSFSSSHLGEEVEQLVLVEIALAQQRLDLGQPLERRVRDRTAAAAAAAVGGLVVGCDALEERPHLGRVFCFVCFCLFLFLCVFVCRVHRPSAPRGGAEGEGRIVSQRWCGGADEQSAPRGGRTRRRARSLGGGGPGDDGAVARRRRRRRRRRGRRDTLVAHARGRAALSPRGMVCVSA